MDLVKACDVIVNAGTAGTGASRASHYARGGTDAIYCGGERDARLGPLVHSALNYAEALHAPMVRLTSCNSTALARLVAGVGVADLDDFEATIFRCSTDNDKAEKGITNGTLLYPASHHARDLAQLEPRLAGQSWAATAPMNCGHVMLVRLRTKIPRSAVLERLAATPRIVVMTGADPIDTAMLRARAAENGREMGRAL